MNPLPRTWVAFCLLVGATLAQVAPRTALIVSSRDNTLYDSATGAISYGAGSQMVVGRTAGGAIRRGLIAFDVAGALPASATITGATLRLYNEMTTSSAVTVSLHRATSNWGEGTSTTPANAGQGAPSTPNDATWIHTFFPGSNWATPGGDFVAVASASTSVGASGAAYTWSSSQLLADVQAWRMNPASNFGWVVRANEATFPTAKGFGTKENSDPNFAPHLIVTYIMGSGAASIISGIGGPTAPANNRFSLNVTPAPTIGTTTTVALTGGPFSSPAQCFLYLSPTLSTAPFALPGASGALYLDINGALLYITLGLSPIGPLPLDGTGSLSFPFPVPNSVSLISTSIDAQALAIDVTGAYLSNGLTLIFG